MAVFNTEQEAIADLKENGCNDFLDMNCEDECGGWDGESRRCYCGNRRVELSTAQLPNGKWYAYGSAY